jgi:hypothetical protein
VGGAKACQGTREKELLAHVDAVAEEHGLYAGALKAAVWAERLVCGPRGITEL